MVSVKYNKPSSLTISYIGGVKGSLTLNGLTLGIDGNEWLAAKRHPIVQALLSNGDLQELVAETTSTAQLTVKDDDYNYAGKHEVVDDAQSGQPIPVTALQSDGTRIDPGLQQQKVFPVVKPETSDLAGFTIDEAEEIIAAESDIETLLRWQEEDSRKGIKTLTQRRIEALIESN